MIGLRCINKAKIGISEDFLLRVVSEANLPSKGMLLIILNDGPLSDKNLGICMPKDLRKCNPKEKVFNPYIDLRPRWDCGIAMSKKASLFYEQCPAYFTYYLGHELAHAYIWFTSQLLFVHGCLIQNCIGFASGGEVNQRCELPDEEFADKSGIHAAECLFSRKELNAQIRERLKTHRCEDPVRLQKVLSLSGCPSLGDLEDLRDKLVSLSSRYKDKLIELWREDKDKNSDRLVASYVPDLCALFKRYPLSD